jgi:hypothetical protein
VRRDIAIGMPEECFAGFQRYTGCAVVGQTCAADWRRSAPQDGAAPQRGARSDLSPAAKTTGWLRASAAVSAGACRSRRARHCR